MIHWHHLYILVFILGGILSLIYTPIFQKLAVLTGFTDNPSAQNHKKHAQSTPLLGGAAMFTAWITAIVMGIAIINSFNTAALSKDLAANLVGITFVSHRIFFLGLGAFLATVLGLIDDRFGMHAGIKLLGQITIAAIAVTFGGAKISIFFNDPIFTYGISVFWIVLLMNAINFFDNMDGLAVGTVAIAMTLFTVVAAVNGQYFIAILGALSTGTAAGFWFYNYSPASIFMGDSGSHFLGYLLAIISANITYFSRDYSLTRFPTLIPLFILAIPLFDAFAVVLIRIRNGKPIYVGDHNHLSHRFVKMGLSRKRAVQVVHLMTLIIGLSVLPLLWGDRRTAFVIVAQASLMLLMVSVLQYSVIQAQEKKNDEK